MQHMRKKIAYIRGLAEGMDLRHSKEGRILTNIIQVLEDMAESMEVLEERQDELETYMETIDEDLHDLEEDVYEDIEFADEDNDDYIEATCPDCGDVVFFESDIVDDEDLIEVTCPNCDEVVFMNDGTYELEEDHNHRYSNRTEDI